MVPLVTERLATGGLDANAVIALIALCVSIIGGALVMAWRLGGLERTVKDVSERVKETNQKLEVIDAKADAAKESATAAIAATSAISAASKSVSEGRSTSRQ